MKKRADENKLSDSEEMRDLGVFKGKNGSSGIGKMPDDAENVAVLSTFSSGGLSKKGDRKFVHPKTEENDDAHHTVKTPRISQSDRNLPQQESIKHEEPMVSGNIIEIHETNTDRAVDISSWKCGEEAGPNSDSQTPLEKFNGSKDEMKGIGKRSFLSNPLAKKSKRGHPESQTSTRGDQIPPTASNRARRRQLMSEQCIDEDETISQSDIEPKQEAGFEIPFDYELPIDEAQETPQADVPQTSTARKGKGKAVRVEDWILTSSSPGGPYNPELIPSFGGHVAVDIWNHKERDTPRAHHRGSCIKEWSELTGEAEDLVKRTGLYNLRMLHYANPDSSLIGAFIERWQPDTNTFHMPWGEMTITLHDVCYMMGLRVTGKPLHSTSRDVSFDLYTELIGEPPEKIMPIFGSTGPTFAKIKLAGCVTETNTPPALVTARMYLLYLISATLFVDRSTNRVKPEFLHLLWEIDEVGDYAWGAGVLAHLYRYLGETSRAEMKQMCGCLTLLECWIYEYFPRFRPCTNPKFREGMPRAICYINPARAVPQPVHSGKQMRFYRKVLDSMTEHDVIWVPSGRDVIQEIPITMYLGSLRCLTYTEPYHPYRVMRQFGLVQTIPDPPIKPNKGCYRGRDGTKYKVEYPSSDGTWNIEGGNLFVGYDALSRARGRCTTSPDYMGWYRERTHPQIHPGPTPDPIVQYRTRDGALIDEVARMTASYDPDHAGAPPTDVWRSVYDLLGPVRDRLRLDDDKEED